MSGLVAASGRSLGVSVATLFIALSGCDRSTAPVRVPALPDSFLYVSGVPGDAQIFRWYADSLVRLTSGPGENREPSAAAGRMAFTSYRDGNAEIYLASVDGSDQHRVITSASFDDEPDLSRDAMRLVFVSTRSGAERLYVADSAGANVIPLETGSPANVPETAPAWSPTADRIAFASSRTGSSQIFVVSAAGGAATRLSNESIGAFDPAWSAGGDTIYYVASGSAPELRAVSVATGRVSNVARSPEGYGQPACGNFGCLAVRSPYSLDGSLVVMQVGGRRVTALGSTNANDRDPAVIR